ncbi:MAG: hypothetical protein J1E16_06585 [Muribaculaceae bacterium]|nr:hypothetical protein [Muribaculaceae bacterium]
MTNKTIDVSDLNKLESKLDILDRDVKDKILYSSLVKGGKILVDATKQSLVAKMGVSATRPVRKKNGIGFYKPLVEGVMMSGDKPYCEVKVHILGQGYLRWFETGTQIRQTSKGYNRGSITALNFFLNAKQSSFSQMQKTINENLDKQINKIMR